MARNGLNMPWLITAPGLIYVDYIFTVSLVIVTCFINPLNIHGNDI